MTKPFIFFDQVCLHLGQPPRAILDTLHIEVAQGDFLVILGSNGSGKSSLLKLLDRRYHVTQGTIYFKNKALKNYSQQALSREVVTLTQNPQESLFESLTVLENCLLAQKLLASSSRTHAGKSTPAYFAEYLAPFNPQLPRHLQSLAGQLSGGEQQALALALVSLAEPQLLLLDEHTSALDPHAAMNIMTLTEHLVQRFHMTCILTTHNLELALRYGNRLIALKNGRILRHFDAAQKAQLTLKDLKEQCY